MLNDLPNTIKKMLDKISFHNHFKINSNILLFKAYCVLYREAN